MEKIQDINDDNSLNYAESKRKEREYRFVYKKNNALLTVTLVIVFIFLAYLSYELMGYSGIIFATLFFMIAVLSPLFYKMVTLLQRRHRL